jgi:anti-anti-sigma factor
MKADNSVSGGAVRAASVKVSPPGGVRSDKGVKLRLDAARLESGIVLRCHGQVLFRSEARVLSNVVSEVLPSMRRMVVDLGGIRSIDSGALGELVLTHMWAEAAGYGLKFSSPTESVRQLFETTNLVSVFDVYATVEDALAAIEQEEVQTA